MLISHLLLLHELPSGWCLVGPVVDVLLPHYEFRLHRLPEQVRPLVDVEVVEGQLEGVVAPHIDRRFLEELLLQRSGEVGGLVLLVVADPAQVQGRLVIQALAKNLRGLQRRTLTRILLFEVHLAHEEVRVA